MFTTTTTKVSSSYGCDAVAVEFFRVWHIGRHLAAICHDLLLEALDLGRFFVALFGGAEATRTLLVHLGTRRHAVYGHVEELARSHNGEYAVDELEDEQHHFVLVLWRRSDRRNVS